MSDAVELSRAASREEIVEYLRRRIRELEEELRVLRSLLLIVEGGGGGQRPGERGEEVRVGRRRVAWLYRGEDYYRLVPAFPMPLPRDIREYLAEVAREIAERQAREGVDEEERARLRVETAPDGAIAEIRFEGLQSTLDMLKAKAALKYAVETAWEVYRARRRSE